MKCFSALLALTLMRVGSTMRTAIYARVSTKDQSCDLQLRDLRAYCAARGFSCFANTLMWESQAQRIRGHSLTS
jgi:hypothetical protein